jgi:hypothetical protein
VTILKFLGSASVLPKYVSGTPSPDGGDAGATRKGGGIGGDQPV